MDCSARCGTKRKITVLYLPAWSLNKNQKIRERLTQIKDKLMNVERGANIERREG